jgi:hypothetical protein
VPPPPPTPLLAAEERQRCIPQNRGIIKDKKGSNKKEYPKKEFGRYVAIY